VFVFFLDASGAAKKYVPELGSQSVDHLITSASPDRLYLVNLGVAEILSIFVRKKNAGILSLTEFQQAKIAADSDLSPVRGVHHIVADTAVIHAALPLIETYSLNATDAIVLRCALDLRGDLQTTGAEIVLVSSDARLLRTAKSEGLETFNPETDTQAALDAFLSAP
jgi:predicted nucleic acid-binding protein